VIKKSVHLLIIIQSSGAQNFDHSVYCNILKFYIDIRGKQ